MCEAAGLRVHAYTSPHLVRFSERIVVAGSEIDEQRLTEALEDCETANRSAPITFFEITTAAGFLAFSRTEADVLLLETGLGGRFDATNIVARPVLTAITPVSMDHMHYLGDSLDKIAFEKAGIIKSTVPCISAAQSSDPVRVIAQQAKKMDAPLVLGGRDWNLSVHAEGFEFTDGSGTLALPLPGLEGRHQIDNAALAVACLRRLPMLEVDDAAMARGVQSVRWPARLHHIDTGALASRLPEGWELWLDGGHNPAAAAAVEEFIRRWDDRPLYVIVGMLSNRDPVEFLRPLSSHVDGLHTVTIPGVDSTAAADDVAAAARSIGISAEPAAGIAEAIEAVAGTSRGRARILICGSLYLAGHVLALNAA